MFWDPASARGKSQNFYEWGKIDEYIREDFYAFFLTGAKTESIFAVYKRAEELQVLSTDELGFESMHIKIEYERRKNKVWMFFFLFMLFLVSFGSNFFSMLGRACYHWNEHPSYEQAAMGLCLFFLEFFGLIVVGGFVISIWKNRKRTEYLQRKILVIEEIQNERKKK